MRSLATLSILAGALLSLPAQAAYDSFTNPDGITISDAFAPTKATPYPSSVTVSGMPGIVTKLSVTISKLSHPFPADIDMMLVAPDGTRATIMSDVGAGGEVSKITLTIEDDAPVSMPAGATLTTGSYKPTNNGAGDVFPAPAPTAGSNVALSTFNGVNPNGTWSLYIIDDATQDSGSIGSWSLDVTTVDVALPGELVISEFRLRGSSGVHDEFIKIRNTLDRDHVVQTLDGSAGYAVAASDGVVRFVIPNGTVIPSKGHYLGVNSNGYSLSNYPAGNGTSATGDATYTTDINDNAGIAIFRTSMSANFTVANRLDAVGSIGEANTLYKEGTGYPLLTPVSVDYSFIRDFVNGEVKDTQNNATDFRFIDTNGTSAGPSQRLGAPGPQNLSSPRRRTTGPSLVRTLVDPGVGVGEAPNYIRSLTSDPANNSTFGTILFSRNFTNHTGGNITRLRFRILDLATFPSPSGISDMRPRTSSVTLRNLSNGTVHLVDGTTLEQPPSQLNGGGFNSTFSVGTVSAGTPIPNGGTVSVQFLIGIQQFGTFRLALLPETLPAVASSLWVISGSTETGVPVVEEIPASSINSVSRFPTDVHVAHTASPGLLYQLQSSTNLTSWNDIGAAIPGTGTPQTYVDANASTAPRKFYRLKHVR